MGGYLQISNSAMAEWRRRHPHRITWPAYEPHRNAWRLAEKALGGDVRMVAAYRGDFLTVRYYFRRA